MARDPTPTLDALEEFGRARIESLRRFLERHGSGEDEDTLTDLLASREALKARVAELEREHGINLSLLDQAQAEQRKIERERDAYRRGCELAGALLRAEHQRVPPEHAEIGADRRKAREVDAAEAALRAHLASVGMGVDDG